MNMMFISVVMMGFTLAFSATLLCENLIFYFIILLQRGKVIELRYLGLKETQTSKNITQVYLKKH